jgi:predicted TIM-barrel fold metal-dependent hydrolase
MVPDALKKGELMQNIPVIDIHCHGAGIGAGGSGCRVGRRMRGSWKFRHYLKAFGVTAAELQREGDMLILRRLSERLAASRAVDLAVLFALDGAVDAAGRLDEARTELFIPNAFVAKACGRYANLLFGASVNPLRRDALDRLDRVAGNGAVLVKWLPSIQGIDPAGPSLIPFYRRLAELGLPLLSHTGEEHSFTRADNTLADPQRLRLPLEQGVTVIAAHCASNGKSCGQANFQRFLTLMRQFPNLHGDVSALTQINRPGHLQRILQHTEFHDRLHYGTDMPLPCTGLTSPWFQLGRLPLAAVRKLASLDNPWDRDLQLKLALGMPARLLGNAHRLLRRISSGGRST